MNQQSTLLTALTSQVGRKILTGITGVLLVGFVIMHLLGNLQLLISDPEPFNKYAKTLHDFGVLLYVVEIGLGAVILLHAWIGISIFLRKRKARDKGYAVYKSKGAPSRQSFASRTMIITGSILLVFLVIHIVQFRFGPAMGSGYVYDLNGEPVRDLHRLVMETFTGSAAIAWVIFYVGVMALLGFHLRHGIWSALQSLGAMKPRFSNAMYAAALVLGILLAVGFLILPIWIFVQQGAS
jgi:succinate dehydrogenase / fumarate reductase cytochrome b subunit